MHGLQAPGGEGALGSAPERRPPRPYRWLLAAAALVVTLDQATKQVALAALADGPIDVLGGIVTLRLTYNPGGAFGLLQGLPGLFLVATVAVIAFILVWGRRVTSIAMAVALGLVLGGGLGNLADRVFRSTGGRVVDFVDVHFWPVFNVADSSIVVGVGLILVLSAREERRRERASTEEHAGG